MRKKDKNHAIIDSIVEQMTYITDYSNIAYDNTVLFGLQSIKSGENSDKLEHYLNLFKNVAGQKLA